MLLSPIYPSSHLPAKLIRPEAEGFLPRERLFQGLDAARKLGSPIIWIVAPPGSGKTVLATSYIQSRRLTALWYQLDASDADPATFFHYIGRAAERLGDTQDAITCAPLPALTAEYLSDLHSFTRRYFEKMCARLAPPSVLVLDNYQEIPEGADLHDLVRVATELLPRGVHLLIISRTGPPPIFARFQIYGAVYQLDWNDLRLTFEETLELATFLSPQGGRPVSPMWARRLHARTLGWAAGLIFMLRTAKQGTLDQSWSEIPSQSILFDYISAELFAHLPEPTQLVLLELSLVPRITAAIARSLAGDDTSTVILETLSRNHFLIMTREGADTVYEFHPLFSDFLQARAERDFSAERLRELRVRAAELMAELGEIDIAVELYLAASEASAIATLLLREAPILLTQGRYRTLDDWLAALPVLVLDAHPWLHYYQGIARLPFNVAEARVSFELAYKHSESAADPTALYTFCAAVAESYHLEWNNFVPLERWLNKFEHLRTRFPDFPSPAVEMRALTIIGPLTDHYPEYPPLPSLVERGLMLFLESGELSTRLVLGAYLIEHYLFKGQLEKGELVIQFLAPLLSEADVPITSGLQARFWMALFHAVRGYFVIARQTAEEALKIAEETGVHLMDMLLRHVLAYVGVFRGDSGAALGDRVDRMFDSMPGWTHMIGASYHHACAMEALLNGDVARAMTHAEGNVTCAAKAGFPFAEALGYLLHATALYRVGQAPMARLRAKIEHARTIAERMRSRTLAYLCDVLDAMLAFDNGDDETGLVRLASALAFSRVAGGLVWPMWGAKSMATLYARALNADIEVDYVQSLIRRMDLTPPDLTMVPGHWPWPVQIRTFGGFKVCVNGEPLHVHGKAQHKPLELLKAVIALGGEGVSITRLCDTLWRDAEGGSARSAFDTALHRLRRMLGREEALLVQDGKVSVNPQCCQLDTQTLERHLKSVDAQLTASPQVPALEQCAAQLCDLYGNGFLPDDEDQPCIFSAHEQWKRKFLRRLTPIGQAFEAVAEFRLAIKLYERGLEHDPLAEELYRSLMACHATIGQIADAIAACQRCQDMLARALGTTPSCETRALLDKILSQSPNP